RVADIRGVSVISSEPIDLATPQATFTITGCVFAHLGFGLPPFKSLFRAVLIAQARATGLSGSTTLTVPYPTPATSLTPNMSGLSAGTVQAQAWQQTSSAPSFSLIGSATLTVTDTRTVPGMSGSTPNPIDP